MTDIARYVTTEVIEGFAPALQADARYILRGALPRILAAHERDVLREAADRLEATRHMDSAAGRLRQWADEAEPS